MFAARVSTRAVAVVIDGAVVGGPVVAIPPGAGIQQRGQGAHVRADDGPPSQHGPAT
ncbi:hypothetical protein ACFOLD_08290 [Kocuria carniphila]|uniref:hypothetical protein n=1 Tax=Kocuria carniphila TaxID=262208 RepID=UPI00361A90C7